MAGIPRFQSRFGVPLNGQNRPQLNLPDGRDYRVAATIVGAVGQGIGDLQAMKAREERQKIAEEAARLKQEEEDGKAWAGPVVAQANLDIGSSWYELQGSVPDSGAGLADGVQKRIGDIYGPLEEAATTPSAKKAVQEARRSAEATWVPKAREKEFDTRNAWRANQGEVALNTGIASVNAAQTTDEVDLQFGQQVAAIQPLYSGIEDPQARGKATLDAVQKLADAAYERKQVLGATQTGEVPPQGVVGPVADAIRAEATAQGQNADVLLTIAALENPKGDPRIENKKSSATGIFQHTQGTWEAQGGTKADRFDPRRQIELGVKLTAQNRAALRSSLGREPTGGELYLAHQQGLGGARALLNAGPGMSAIDALTPVYGGNRALATQAVVNNGGTTNISANQFVQKWQRKFDTAAAGGAITRLATPAGRERGDAEAAKIVEKQRDEKVGRLEIAIDDGTANRTTLDAYKQAGVIKPGSPEDVRLSKRLTDMEEKAAKEAAEKAERQAIVSGALTGGHPIDPTDAKSKAAVDEDYEARAATWKPEEREANSIAYAARVGYVPDALKATLVGSMRSTDPEKRLASARLYGRLRATNPALVNGLPGDVSADAYYLMESQRKGMTAKEAIDSLSFAEKMTPEDISARDGIFRKGLGPKEAVATSYIQREMAGDRAIKDERALFGGDFTAPPEMIADVVYLAQRAYRKHGDMEAALATGYDQARRVWGPSVINGQPRMMKNAPEVIYGIPEMNATDNAKWMRDQAARELGVNKPKDLQFIEAPGMTTREGRPAYFVLQRDGDTLKPVTQNGKPVAWHPQWATSPEKIKRDKARADGNADELRRSKAYRERVIQGREQGEYSDGTLVGSPPVPGFF